MQKITFGGTEYIKASEVAKKFRYTQDYVGQLCRNKKVNARLVGRNWYVELDSVTAYRKTKHKTQKQAAKKKDAASKVPIRRRSRPTKKVEPVTRAKTLRVTSAKTQKKDHEWPVAIYAPDNATLVPTPQPEGQKSEAPKAPIKKTGVTIEARPAVTVKVKSSNPDKETNFTSEKLPEISLSGKLSVDTITENDLPNTGANPPEETPVVNKRPATTRPKPATAQSTATKTEQTAAKQPAKSLVAPQEMKKPNFTPESLEKKNKNYRRSTFVTLASVTLALAVSVLLVGLGSEVFVAGSEHQNSLHFTLANLQQIVHLFE